MKQIAAIIGSLIAVAAVSYYHNSWRKYFSAVEKFQSGSSPFGPNVSPQATGLIFMAIAFVVGGGLLIWSRWMATPKPGVLGNMSNFHPMNPPAGNNTARRNSVPANNSARRNSVTTNNSARRNSVGSNNSVANLGNGGRNNSRKTED